jgi:hypothetical protein
MIVKTVLIGGESTAATNFKKRISKCEFFTLTEVKGTLSGVPTWLDNTTPQLLFIDRAIEITELELLSDLMKSPATFLLCSRQGVILEETMQHREQFYHIEDCASELVMAEVFCRILFAIMRWQQRELTQNFTADVLQLRRNEQGEKRISFKIDNVVIFLKLKEIKYILASGNYIEIITAENKKYLVRETISRLAQVFRNTVMFRIHRSCIVNKSFVNRLVYSSHGELDVGICDSELLRVGKSYKQDFLNHMDITKGVNVLP